MTELASAESTVSSPPRRRPFGAYAIVVLLAVLAITLYVDQLGLRDENLLLGALARLGARPEDARVALTLMYALLIMGLLTLQRWALMSTMIVAGAVVATTIWLHFQGTPEYLGMLVGAIAIFYLNLREVREAFGY